MSVVVDSEKCNCCRICVRACPEPGVLRAAQDKKTVIIFSTKCKGCYLCVGTCPKKAISRANGHG
jgi:pyruvate ferredoxin oxidoreductase delta subunit